MPRCRKKGALTIRWLTITIATLTIICLYPPSSWAAPPTAHHLTPAAAAFRDATYRTHPCLALIIDREDPSWDPTISYGGGHNVNDSYGLGQANPGTKMASYGRDWATSRATQLRWTVAYAVGRYRSECGAWAFWRAHSWW